MEISTENTDFNLEEWNGSYIKRLMPFMILSVFLHVIIIAVTIGLSLLYSGGKGLEVTLFAPGDPTSAQNQPLLAGFNALERTKIFRIDFFSEVIPWQPPEPEIIPEDEQAAVDESIIDEEEIEDEPEPEEPEPEEQIEELNPDEETDVTTILDRTGPESALIEEPSGIGEFDETLNGLPQPPDRSGPAPLLDQPISSSDMIGEEPIPDAYGDFSYIADLVSDPDNEILEAYALPEWVLQDVDDEGEVFWGKDNFLGEYTIYIVGDVSSRHGIEELFAWNYVIRHMVTNPQAAYPPYVVTIGSAFENPYGYDNERIREILNTGEEEEWTFGVSLADSEGAFVRSLGYHELPQPIVLFTDQYGYIRLIMIGRVKDIRNENIQATMVVIADMWQWTEEEVQEWSTLLLLTVNLLRIDAYDVEKRSALPHEVSREIAPTWGSPPRPVFF